MPSTGAVVENVRATDGWSVKADVRSEGAIVGRVLVVAGVETASFEKAAPNEDVADRAVVGLEEMLLTVVKVLRMSVRGQRRYWGKGIPPVRNTMHARRHAIEDAFDDTATDATHVCD